MKLGRTSQFLFSNASVLTLSMLFAPHAVAANESDKPANAVSEVIVTAQHRSERLEDVPLSIVSASSEMLAKAGISGTRDLQKIAPGLTFAVQGAYAQPTIRGVTTTTAGFGTDSVVALYIDGVYQTSQAGNLSSLPDVSRVEIAKGPQGTLFGRNATGGAIRVFTKAPQFTPSGTFQASGGEQGHGGRTAGTSFFVTGPITDTIAASLSGSYDYARGYMVNVFDHSRLNSNAESLRGKLLFRPTSDIELTGFVGYSYRSDPSGVANAAYNGNTIGRLLSPGYVPPTSHYEVNIDFKPKLAIVNYTGGVLGKFDTSIGTISTTTAYVENNTRTNNFDADMSPVPVAHYRVPTHDASFVQEATLSSNAFGKFSFVAGANYYHDKANYTPVLEIVNFIGIGAKIKRDAYAAFSEVNYMATDRLTIIGGLRYSYEENSYDGALGFGPLNHIGKHHWDNLMPRASIRYNIAERTNVYFTYSQGFKSGVFNSTSLSPVPANPEKISSYEVGYKTYNPLYSISAAAFYYDYKDIQVGVLSPIGLAVIENAAKAKMYGIDLEGTLNPSDELQIRAGLSWLPKAKYSKYLNAAVNLPIPGAPGGNFGTSTDASGLRMIRAPRLTGNLSADYTKEFSKGVFGLSGSMYYTSAFNYQILGRVRQSAYATLNGEASWTFGETRIKAAIYGRNLTDKRNILTSEFDGPGGDGVTWGPPREVGLRLNYSF